MLTAIRTHTKSLVVKILAGLLVVSFAVWGIEDMFTLATSSASPIFEVGSLEGDEDVIRDEVRRQIRRLRPMFGNQFTVDQAKALGIVESVVQRQIDDTALRLASQGMGIEISDDLVSKEIRNTPGFQAFGSFDQARFQRFLNENLMTEARYIAAIRGELSNNQLLDSFTSKTAPKMLVDSVYRHRQEKRIAETIVVSDSTQQKISEPDQPTLIGYHKDKASLFTAPEYRALSVVRLDAADLAGEILVANNEVKEAYEARVDEFTTPETRNVKQMIVAEEADAKRASEALSQGRDFAAVAMEIAKMDATAIDLGRVGRADMPFPELTDAVFALKSGESSAPQKSPLGWHVFSVNGIQLGGTKTFDGVKDRLTKDIAMEKAIDSLFELANKLEDSLGGGATLEETASQLNLKVVKFDAVDRSGKGKDSKPISNLPGGDFIGIAFSTEEGAESPLSETGNDGYFVLRVDGITAPVLKPLDTIKAEVIQAWKDEKRAEKSKQAATAIVARVNSGTLLNAIASEMGLEIMTSPALTRQPGKNSGGLPQPLVDKIFSLSKGEAAMARSGSGYAVGRLKEVTTAVPAADKEGLDKISDQLGLALQEDIFTQLAGGLRDRYGVTVNRQAIDGLFLSGVGGSRRPGRGR
ncbi:MAG: Peptidyl-prolyl cis-trans isomerase D [Alphaproteobacteria bacterium MarineAlpha3_Bin2]|jgi:peptidyl-prolyl cis-trans isomerase D|nr:MAG: Peptidyl-prolyl cis-trans isomerase D [Alphaproteobacteria bacterium MarineAlpha3_Bin1]PPR71727.1 MAG: Peptidyl-prolyl cis-trans isomerase D [Alphaproteobacteria bacterium MarineAlpha3_Bin2]